MKVLHTHSSLNTQAENGHIKTNTLNLFWPAGLGHIHEMLTSLCSKGGCGSYLSPKKAGNTSICIGYTHR